MRTPFSYTNRTFLTILSELNTLYPERPAWFKEIIAGMFDIAHWYMDARAQNLLIKSAFTPEAVEDEAAYLDYFPSRRSAASMSVAVTLNVAGPQTVLADDLTFFVTSPQGAVLKFRALTNLVIAAGFTGNVVVYNLEKVSGQSIGTSDGTTAWQEFVINDTNVLFQPAPAISINAFSWVVQDTLVNSLSSDKHFRLLSKPNGLLSAMFGNGIYGAIPPSFPVLATYYKGGGVGGNVPLIGSTISYAGNDARVVSVALTQAASGGSDGDLIEKTRDTAPRFLRVNYRGVGEDDYAKLALRFDASIIQAKAFPGLYGEGTVAVHIIPSGGGNPSSGLKTSLQADLIPRSPLSLVDVRVRNPIYSPQNVTAAIKMRSGPYTFLLYQQYATLACRLIVSEVAKEVIDIFDQVGRGIADAVTYINTKWGYTFGISDYSEITNIIQRRKRDGVNTWGNSIIPNDIIAALDDLTGVDYATVTTPSAIVAIPFHKVSTEGVTTVTQIT